MKQLIFRSAPQPTRSISITQPSPSQVETNKPWSILATSPSTMGATAATSMSNNYPSVSIASSPPVSFKFIQDQEARAHEALRQISNKSLETIQVCYDDTFCDFLRFSIVDRRIGYSSLTSSLQFST